MKSIILGLSLLLVFLVFGTATYLFTARSGPAATTFANVQRLHSEKPEERRAAAEALAWTTADELGLSIPALTKAQEDVEVSVAVAAATALEAAGYNALRARSAGDLDAAGAGLVQGAHDARPAVRVAAALGLVHLLRDAGKAKDLNWPAKPDPATLVEPVTMLLADPAEPVRLDGVRTLALLADQVKFSTPPALVKTLESDPSAEVRATIAGSLHHYRGGPFSVVQALFKTIEAEGEKLPSGYNNCLGSLHPRSGRHWIETPAGEVVPRLVESLSHRNRLVRYNAAALLGGYGSEAAPAIPGLLALLNEPIDAESSVLGVDPAASAVQTLSRVAPKTSQAPDVIAALVRLLADPAADGLRRSTAASALAEFGPAAAESAVPVLIEVLKQPGPTTRNRRAVPAVAAASALGRFAVGTPQAEAVIDALIGALKSEQRFTREAAARSLGLFGPAAARAVAPLKDLSENDDEGGVQEAADTALEKIAPAPTPAEDAGAATKPGV